VLILAYCFEASLTPVWLLLQPRGYLGGFVLYLALAAGVVGIFFGGFTVQLPAVREAAAGQSFPSMFPFLFVTIACGACSGFHGLVCSGTTSKQIAKETHCHPVGYGAMLLEGFVAVIALATLMIASSSLASSKPAGTVYGIGLGRFLAVVIGQERLPFAITFGAMAFSTFVFDTLDVSTRLGRYVLQELFGWKGTVGSLVATGLTIGVPLAFLLASPAGSYRAYWTLFGTSNQLLAALSLMGVAVWLKKSGKRYWYVAAPMVFVAAVTVSSLVLQVRDAFFAIEHPTVAQQVNGLVAVVLFALAASLLATGARALLAPQPSMPATPSVG
jgi:carbon starvation protein